MRWLQHHYQGILLAILLALGASLLGKYFPIIGGPVFGIILGMILGNLFTKPEGTVAGLKFTSKTILQWAIIALGGGLSLTQVYKVGMSSLSVMVFTLSAAFITAYLLGRLMHIPGKLTSLIGMGTAICGGSAIAAIAPIIEAEDQEIAYAISTVFLFNVVAVLIFPPLGHLLKFSDKAFGLWAGTAINDTSSVVAAGYSFSNLAGNYATIVKLTRTTMIIPISLIFAAVTFFQKRKINQASGVVHYQIGKIFPWFILGFLGMSLANTLGIINSTTAKFATETGKFMIVLALCAIGLNSDFKKMMKTGILPLILGLFVWFSVSIVSLIVQFLTGQI
jgi:uncharacterized integral membrane protein (TIGR00698 family)